MLPGVYETLRSHQGVFALLPEHQKRLFDSCSRLGLRCPDLKEVLSDLVGQKDLWVRVLVHAPDSRVECVTKPLEPWTGSFLYEKTWTVKWVHLERELPELKHLNTLPQMEARSTAEKEGYDEVILINSKGEVTEGGITNVFFIKSGHLITPAQDLLPGIARTLILETAKDLCIPVELRSVNENELKDFDGLFLCNSVRGIIQVGPHLALVQDLAEAISKNMRQRIHDQRDSTRRDSQSNSR